MRARIISKRELTGEEWKMMFASSNKGKNAQLNIWEVDCDEVHVANVKIKIHNNMVRISCDSQLIVLPHASNMILVYGKEP